MRYKKGFSLPKCFSKQKRYRRKCRCFKNWEVLYNPANSLSFICRMTNILKNFDSQFQKHDNLYQIEGEMNAGKASNSNIRNMIKYHSCTLEYFRDFLIAQYDKLALSETFEVSKSMRFLQSIAFVRMQVKKCLVQLKQTPQEAESNSPKIYQDLVLFSHLHTPNMFKHFILDLELFITSNSTVNFDARNVEQKAH